MSNRVFAFLKPMPSLLLLLRILNCFFFQLHQFLLFYWITAVSIQTYSSVFYSKEKKKQTPVIPAISSFSLIFLFFSQ